MPPKPASKDLNIPLVPGGDAMRLATLERMRGKLAGRSQDLAVREVQLRKISRRKALSWGWRIALAAAFLCANAAVIGMTGGSKAEARPVKEKRAPALPTPKNLGINDQALYWTYALYDFGRLKARFGAADKAVVDATQAKARLLELLPNVNAKTRFIIESYQPKPGA